MGCCELTPGIKLECAPAWNTPTDYFIIEGMVFVGDKYMGHVKRVGQKTVELKYRGSNQYMKGQNRKIIFDRMSKQTRKHLCKKK